MDMEELRGKVADYKERLTARKGRMISSSASGPIGISAIEWLVKALEAQDRRIKKLEARASKH